MSLSVHVKQNYLEVTLPDGSITLIDREDEWILLEFPRWSRTKGHVSVSRLVPTDYGNAKEVYYLHRVVTKSTKENLRFHVDHINRNGLDNRRSNLRFATPSQNTANRYVNKRSNSGYRGVFWDKSRKLLKQYRAYISNGSGRYTYIGYFLSAEEAARAYDKAALEQYGPFAVLNFPAETHNVNA